MTKCEVLEPRWDGPILVVATGASLRKIDPESCRGYRTIAVKEAWQKFPQADALFAVDNHWWLLREGARAFKGERWSTHHDRVDHKYAAAAKYGIRLVRGEMRDGFSPDPAAINYGPMNSLFHAVQLAIHWLKRPGRIILLGADMRGGWFFGLHPRTAKTEGNWNRALDGFGQATRRIPPGIEIVNATRKSLLRCFPMMPLEQALGMQAAA